MAWVVRIHPSAQQELDALPAAEQVAVLNAVEKLIALGPGVPFPHQSHIEGSEGLRELRPRRGRSRWRAFYGEVETTFVIAGSAPRRQSTGVASNGRSRRRPIVSRHWTRELRGWGMRLSDLPSAESVIKEKLKDPAFRAEWERTAVARAVAIHVIAYRAEHGITQTELARRLGMKQPAVARLEAGEHNPSFETLARLSSALGIEFHIAVTPDGVAI